METMTQTPRPAVPTAAYTFVRPDQALLPARRPEVLRVRAVSRSDGTATVYVGYPEDTGRIQSLAGALRGVTRLVDDAAANNLGEPSRLLTALPHPVTVHVFAPGPEVPGASVEIFLDMRGGHPWELEVVFDGADIARSTAHWLIDVLLSATAELQRREDATRPGPAN